MNFDEFTGEIQHRLELPGTGEAVRAIRASLLPLGERIPAGAAEDLAASLPIEIKWYMTGAVHEHGQRFDWREYLKRVSEISSTRWCRRPTSSNSATNSPRARTTRTGANCSKSSTRVDGVNATKPRPTRDRCSEPFLDRL